ncbi:PEP-CTERM sorting domain-containing protein [Duganella sp. P38]|jgi:hypothetical protein|uniref:PEP-CTERM sorting domain-containing protein n=1 Tax=Duganella sp. P38 TaxID=3423949 RepID=UPI003D78E9C9
MNFKQVIGAAGLSLLAAIAAPGHAAASSSASLSGFSYKLIDLDPDDGITAGLTMSFPDYFISAAAYRDNSGVPSPEQVINNPGTAHVTSGGGSATASFDGTTAKSLTTNGHMPLVASTSIVSWYFTLTPNTTVVFSGLGAIHADRAGGVSANAASQLYATYVGPNAPYDTTIYDGVNTLDGLNLSKQLSLTLTSGGYALDGQVGILTSSDIQGGSIAAVPEPSTYALFIGGLAALACARRRKRQA